MTSLTSGLNVATFPKILKPILPFLQRANDFEKRAPLVAFYCRTYAAQLGITIIQSSQTKEEEPTRMLIDLMDKLESDKQQLNANTEEGRATVELFALKMFKKADDADRAGRHDAIVARLFYASSVLMEVTKQFGELTEDIMEKQKYARWKAAEISRAIKTGVPIQPGPYGSDTSGEGGYEEEQETETEQNEAHEQEMQSRQQLLRHSTSEMNQDYGYDQQNQYQEQDHYQDQYNQQQYGQQNANYDSYGQYGNQHYDPYNQQPQDEQMYDQQQHFYDQQTQQQQSRQQSPQQYIQPPPIAHQQSPISPLVPPSSIAPPPSTIAPPPTRPVSMNKPPVQQPPQPPVQQVQQPKPVQRQPQSPVQQPKPTPIVQQPKTSSVKQALPESFQNEKEEIPLEDVMKAQKFTKFAMSSLQFNDIETAKKYLRDALQLIGGL
jgi:vacuolar protein sorting-associated protein VTA1